jgi:transcriptional regulator with XRE-family HTH domain
MVGEKIREVRQSQGKSLAEIAGKAKISVATLSRIETDKQSLDLGLFLSIAQVLQVSAQQLLGDDGNGNGGDPLARRIAALGSRERLDLWKELAEERRTLRGKRRGTALRGATAIVARNGETDVDENGCRQRHRAGHR